MYSDSVLPKDLKEFLEANSEVVADQDVYLLVRQYSALQNGRLSLEDFYQFVISSTQDSLANLVKQRFHTREIKPGVKYSFVSLLKEELKLQHTIEGLKIKLFQNPDFSL